MKKAASIIVIILLFCMPLVPLAQGNKADSLGQIFRQATNDSVRITACWDLYDQFEETNRDSAQYYMEVALKLSRQNGKKLAEARCLVSLAYQQLASGRYDASLGNLLQAFSIAENIGNEKNSWLSAWSGSPQHSQPLVLAYTHHTFANLMTPTRNTKQQVIHYREALRLGKQVGNAQRILLANLGLGRTYLDNNSIDSALIFEKEATRYAQDSALKRFLPAILSYVGAIYFKKNEPALALQNLHYGIKTANEYGNPTGRLAQIYYRLTQHYLSEQNKDSALYYALNFKQAMEIVGSVSLSTVDKGLAYESLYLAYQLNRQLDSASRYQGLALITKDSINNARMNSLAEFQNLNLTEQLRLRDLEKEQQLYQSRVSSYALLAGLIIFSLIAFILYRNNKQKQKANVTLAEKNRDLEIESALEKIRSRSLAMHKSEELQDVTNTVFEQMRALKIEAQTLTIFVTIEGSKDYNCWLQNDEQNYFNGIRFPYFKGNTVSEDHQMNSGDLETKTYTRDLKDDWFHFMFTQSEMRNIPESRKRYVLDSDYFTASVAEMKYTKIGMYRYSDKAFTNQEYKILKRFAQVFEQAYIRFLDLQKAEAQAREAQIEVAMEKVRSRTMAMHKSEELKDVIQVVYEQFIHLHMHVEHAGFIIDYKNRDDMHIWLADPNRVPSEVFIPYFDSPHWNSFLEAKTSGKDFFTNLLSFEEKNKFYQGLFNFFPIPDDAKDFYFNCPGLAISTALLDNVGLYIENFSGKPYSDEENGLLMRFAKVFQQTYTRFMDLQKAESQAREAQIEAALERVRSRTMSMQKSEELGEVASVLFKQMNQLVTNLWTCGFVLCEKNRNEDEWWLSMDGDFTRGFFLPNVGDHAHATLYEGWLKGDALRTVQLEGEALQQHYRWLMEIPVSRRIFEEMDAAGLARPDWQKLHAAYFSKGYLILITREPSGEEEIFKRFAAVFNLTYTRFNDLQIAEAHAAQAEQDLIAIKEAKQKAEQALTELQATQKQLIQAEKMASLGELTAGIAHEIQNPLNFVNNFSEVNKELLAEMREEIEKGNLDEVKAIVNDMSVNEEKISEHGRRADAIVKGMLQHSRSSSGEKESTNINALADEYLRLAYHGLKAKDRSFNASFKTDFDNRIGNINIIPQEIGRVLLNLINNAFYAVDEKKKQTGNDYEPEVIVTTKLGTNQKNEPISQLANELIISVRDNGNGIPQKILDKIFQPFFTTKPTGQGTGLGLSLSYDIVKAHGGVLTVETREGQGSEFIIQLPISIN